MRKNHDNTVNIWRHVFSVKKWVPLYWTGTQDTLVAANNAQWETSVFRSEIRSVPFEMPASGDLKKSQRNYEIKLRHDLKRELELIPINRD